jgi:hypothetical protein
LPSSRLVAPASAAAGTLDQSQTNFNASFSIGGNGQLALTFSAAQTFTAGLSGNLDQVDLHLRRTTSPPSGSCDSGSGITLEVRSVSGGNPSDTVLASVVIPPSSVPANTFNFVSVSLPSPPAVIAGTQYALAASAPDASCTDIGTPYDWGASGGNPYAGGQTFFQTNSGGWSASANDDQAFRTYVASPPPSDGTTPPPDGTTPPPNGTTPPTPSEFTRTLSIAYTEKTEMFKGRLRAQSLGCVSERKVKLFQKEKGSDPKLGSDATDQKGKYSVKEKNAEGKFYAEVKRTSVSGGICLAAQSKTIEVD